MTSPIAEEAPSADEVEGRDPWWFVGPLVVLASCLTVLAALHPELLIRNTTTAGGDMGAHVWFPAYLRDHLLPHWRIAGWAPDWFAGFPAGQFYFPLPAVMVLLGDLLLPYDVAFKIVTVIGVVGMPAAAYAFGRGLRAPRPTPELFSVATVLFLFFKGASGTDPGIATIAFNQGIMGGTIRSTLAGEFSFSLALALALLFLGAFASALEGRTRSWVPALLLAATVLSHIVVAIFAVVGALVVWATARSVLRVLPRAAAIGVVGGLLTMAWSLPLLASFGYTANMRYEKITDYVTYLFPTGGSSVGPFPPFMWWVLALAGAGVIAGVGLARRATIVVAITTAIFGAVFVVWPELHAWNLRFLPFWYLGLGLLAATAVGEGIIVVARSAPRFLRPAGDPRGVQRLTAACLLLALSVFCLGRAFGTRGFLDFWSEWNYSGYQDERADATRVKAWPELEALVDEMRALPPGRAVWEGGGALDNYGTPLALELLPHWTDGRIQSVEGLYFESSATTPYHFMGVSPISGPGNASNPVRGLDYRQIGDFALGVRWMQVMGERYYLAWSDAAKAAADGDPRLRLVATSPDTDGQDPKGWNIYRVRGSRLVEGLRAEPVVAEARAGSQPECFSRAATAGARNPELGGWECLGVGWFNDPDALDRVLATSGPARWRRIANPVDARASRRRRLPAVEVRDVQRTDHSISFRVSRPGVPVIVRESYYPNWRVRGAEGPYRVTPNFMVVVPTSRSVTVSFERSPAEWVGIMLSLLGLVGLVVLGRRWPRLAQDPEPPPEYERILAPTRVAEAAPEDLADAEPDRTAEAVAGSPDDSGPAPVDVSEDPSTAEPRGWGRIGGDGPAGAPADHE